MTDHHNGLAVQTADATDQGRIIRECTIAMQLIEFVKNSMDIIQRVRPLRMTSHLCGLPGGKIGEDTLDQGITLGLEVGHFVV